MNGNPDSVSPPTGAATIMLSCTSTAQPKYEWNSDIYVYLYLLPNSRMRVKKPFPLGAAPLAAVFVSKLLSQPKQSESFSAGDFTSTCPARNRHRPPTHTHTQARAVKDGGCYS